MRGDLVTNKRVERIRGKVVRVVGARKTVTEATYQKNKHDDDSSDDDQSTSDGTGLAVLCPLASSQRVIFLQLLSANFVVDQTAERNAIAEYLEIRDWVAKDDHGRDDQEDILEHTAEGVDERRGFANLVHQR